MLFNSFQFFLFFAAFVPVYFVTPMHRRWVPILLGSYLFYMAWNVALSALLLTLTMVAYVIAILIDDIPRATVKKWLLVVGIVAELTPLIIFKYANFLITSANDLLGASGSEGRFPLLDLIIPVGISFHTFQMIGYLADVHAGRCAPERHLGRFASFVVFFPQLVAGPIERSTHMLPQFRRPTRVEYARFRDGTLQFLWGLFKKVCIADLVAPFIAAVYASPRAYNGSYLLLATLLFSIQIYCDFSGYSDMALGIARILGYDLLVNFKQPYFAASLTEFWRCWHISLSTWFRDYVYIPLGGNRVSPGRRHLNILVVFILSGIWHGASWTFAIWGLIHGVWLIGETILRERIEPHLTTQLRDLVSSPAGAVVRWVATMSVVISGWIYFRAVSVADALYILRHLFDFGPVHYGTFKLLSLPSFEIGQAMLSIGVMFAIDAILRFEPLAARRAWQRRPVRWALAIALVYSIVFFGVFEKVEFIYFAF